MFTLFWSLLYTLDNFYRYCIIKTPDMSNQPEVEVDEDAQNQTSEKDQSESSMDGPFRKLKEKLGIKQKKDSVPEYTATVIPAGTSNNTSTIAETVELTNVKEASVQSGPTNDSSNIRTVYKDTGTAMISGNTQTVSLDKGNNQNTLQGKGDNSSNREIGLSLNLPFIVEPADNNPKPGLALLITGQEFQKGLGSFRHGAQKDLNNMYELFYKLNFEIRWSQFVNRTTEDLRNELVKCAEDPILEKKQCLVIVVSSHGGEVKLGRPYRPENIPHDINVYGHAITTNNGMIPTTEILDIFDEDSCPYMEGKPKLLFIQACRSRNDVKKVDKGFDIKVTEKSNSRQIADFYGDSTMDVHHKMETSEDIMEPIQDIMAMKDIVLTPCYQDFMVVFSSASEYVGWSENSGGVLLTAMKDVFQKKIDRKEKEIDLLSTMTEVCNKMTEYESNMNDQRYDKSKSVMCMLHMLADEVIFKPRYT